MLEKYIIDSLNDRFIMENLIPILGFFFLVKQKSDRCIVQSKVKCQYHPGTSMMMFLYYNILYTNNCKTYLCMIR